MKKITLLAVIAISVSVVSCKKDYVCQCTTVGTNASGSGTTSGGVVTTQRQISKTSKKTAEAICGNYTQTSSSSYTQQGVTYTFSDTEVSTCSVK